LSIFSVQFEGRKKNFLFIETNLGASGSDFMHDTAIEIFYPSSVEAWRNWLEENHLSKQGVWLVCYTKNSTKKSITWSESVDVALCFGWIDSKKIKVDAESSHQFFSRRKAKSTWSKINKQKVQFLIETGQMSAAGYNSIEVAKQNGSWTILDQVEELIVPVDLEAEFLNSPVAMNNFENFSKSSKKAILQWITLAKRPETRYKRIIEVVERDHENLKPSHL